MVNTSTKQLIKQLEDSRSFLKKKKLSSDYKLALANYIGNIYRALLCLGKIDVVFDKKRVFGSEKKYNEFVKKMDFYSDLMINNYIQNKNFHREFFSEILPDVEDSISNFKNIDDIDDIILSRNDFFDIFYQFMRSINQEDLFDELYNNGHIYSTLVGQDEGNVGFTLYGPVNRNLDVFIKDLKYSLFDMNTLAHEMGHCFDLKNFKNGISDYNKFFYLSFFGEVCSRLFERLLLDFLRNNNIYADKADVKQIEFELLNYDFIIQSYMFSLFSNKFILEDKYIECDSKEIVKMVKDHFVDPDFIESYIDSIISFDLAEVYNYCYGDIVSMFLHSDIKNYGFSLDVFNSFFDERCKLFDEDYFIKNGYTPEKYLKLYKKSIKNISSS